MPKKITHKNKNKIQNNQHYKKNNNNNNNNILVNLFKINKHTILLIFSRKIRKRILVNNPLKNFNLRQYLYIAK